MKITAQKISELVGGFIVGDELREVHGPERIEVATQEHITFLSNPKYEKYIYLNQPGIILVSETFEPKQKLSSTLIRVVDVARSVQKLLSHLNQSSPKDHSGISDRAIMGDHIDLGEWVQVGALAFIDQHVTIGRESVIHPQVYIGEYTRIGSHVEIHPGARIYKNTIIGDRCIIHANAVIGSDGFGYTKDSSDRYNKIPHLGNVVLEDDVEIGANTVIDRAVLGSTIIGQGSKLDNLIQVAHNVEIGKNTGIAAQAGIAGSIKIGDRCMVGGQAGIAGHIEIADDTMIQAQSGVMSTIATPKTKWMGSPALSYFDYLKSYAIFRDLPNLKKELDRIKKALKI